MRLLTEKDISGLLRNLTPADARQILDIFSSGLASYAQDKTKDNARIYQPQRTVFQNHEGNTVLAMPVSDGDTVVKVATVPVKGDIAGAITVYSSVGELLGVLNAAEITAFRTALAAMTILTRWTPPQTSKVCVFGSGKQAEWHVRLALLLIPGIQQITVFNRGADRLRALEENALSALRKSYPDVKFHTVAKQDNSDYQQDLSASLADADIICCCTPSTHPLFGSKELQSKSKPRFLSLIGSYKPGMCEIDSETIDMSRQSGKIWVDLKEACLEEAGELIDANLEEDDLEEIGELFSRDTDNSKSHIDASRELTIFKCVGFGFMDLVISKALLHMAEDAGQGSVFKDF